LNWSTHEAKVHDNAGRFVKTESAHLAAPSEPEEAASAASIGLIFASQFDE
jgi:hypothetical protein